MNNKMKYTVPGQVLSIIVTHIEAAFLFFFVWLLAISITSTKIGALIYCVISSIFYFMMMYSAGYTVVKNDKKSYTDLTPFPYKGALLSIGLLVLNILFLVIYRLSWSIGVDADGHITNVWSLIGNILGMFWFAPYRELLGHMEIGYISPCGYAVILLFHVVACTLGYFAGYKDFDISAKMRFLVYDQKKKK